MSAIATPSKGTADAKKSREFVVVAAADVPAYATIYVQGTSYGDALGHAEVESQKLPPEAFEADPSEFRNRLRIVSVCDSENDTLNVDSAIAGNFVRNQRTDAEQQAFGLVCLLLSKVSAGTLQLPAADLEQIENLHRTLAGLDVPGGPISVQPWAEMFRWFRSRR